MGVRKLCILETASQDWLIALMAAAAVTILWTRSVSAHTYLVDQTTKTSPNGVSMAIMERYSDKTTQLLYRSDSFQTFDKVDSFPFLVEDFSWLKDDKSVVYLAKPDAQCPAHLYKTDTARKLTVDLTPFPRRTAAGYYITGDNKLCVLLDLNDENVFDVYQIDLPTGTLTAVEAPLQFPDTFRPVAQKPASQPVFPPSLLLPGQDPQALDAGTKLMQIPLLSDTGKEALSKPEGRTLKPWKESERQLVEDTWRQVVARVPGLVMRAANGRRIVIMRCTKIPQQSSHLVPGFKPQDAPAEAQHTGLIFISDLFFTGQERDRVFSLVHELVHIADRYGRLSTSKEWTDLMRGKLVAVRTGLMARNRIGLPRSDADEDQLARCFNLPSAYSASGFQEALAEVTAAWALDYGHPSDKEKAFIKQRIFTLDKEAMTDDETLMKTDLECKDYKKKLAIAREILSRDPDSFAARLMEIISLFELNRQHEKMVAARKLVDLIKSRGVFTGDFGYDEALYYLGSSEYDVGNYRAALKLLKELVAIEPDSTRYKEAEKSILDAMRRKKH